MLIVTRDGIKREDQLKWDMEGKKYGWCPHCGSRYLTSGPVPDPLPPGAVVACWDCGENLLCGST